MRYLAMAVLAELVALAAVAALTTPIGPLAAAGCLVLFLSGVALVLRSCIKFVGPQHD